MIIIIIISLIIRKDISVIHHVILIRVSCPHSPSVVRDVERGV